jgi:hypothetical protein
LGAVIYGLLLRQGIQRVPGTQLVTQNTILGWIVSGSISSDLARRAEANSETPLRSLHCSFETQLLNTLEKLWTVEEVSSPRNKFTAEEISAEQVFKNAHRREAAGRYVVRLPLTVTPDASAETRRMTLGSLHHMHRRFNCDPELANDNRELIETYELLGHMKGVRPLKYCRDAWRRLLRARESVSGSAGRRQGAQRGQRCPYRGVRVRLLWIAAGVGK